MSAQNTQTAPTIRPPTPEGSGQSTPSAPGTPNSTTTSLSALSTTAIKDGHRGSAHPHAFPFPLSTTTSHSSQSPSSLAAERADRISRLPGFGAGTNGGSNMRIKSTVGSASATGSVGRTTQDGTGSSVVTEGSVGESEMMDVESEVGTDVAVVGDGAADWKREVTKAEERGEVGKFSWEEGRK